MKKRCEFSNCPRTNYVERRHFFGKAFITAHNDANALKSKFTNNLRQKSSLFEVGFDEIKVKFWSKNLHREARRAGSGPHAGQQILLSGNHDGPHEECEDHK